MIKPSMQSPTVKSKLHVTLSPETISSKWMTASE